MYTILGYTDTASDTPYLEESATNDNELECFKISLEMLRRVDHALILSNDDLENLNDRDYFSVAPYALHISKGQYA